MRELLEQFFRHYLRERNLEDTLALLTDQVISLGTGEQEVARNKEELRALMECEFKEMPQPLDYELFNYTENPLGEYGWSIFTNVLAKIDSEGVTMEMLTRLTRDEKSRTFSSNSQRSHILRTSSRSIRLILSSIVSLAVSLKCTRTI